MTLTELKYIVALARERHFGRAAQSCFVSQPSLSLAVKKLEENLDVTLFERSSNEVTLTPLGEEIVAQAQRVLLAAAEIKDLARRGKDPVAGALRVGLIYTIAPYVLPELVPSVLRRTPQMPLLLQENYTHQLLDMLRNGEIDCAFLAEPFADAGLAVAPLYDEPFYVALAAQHPLAQQTHISTDALHQETLLLLGAGHCFRDHVLQVCPEFARFASDAQGIRKSFEGSSLETIKHMVASGLGLTLVPALSVPRALRHLEPPQPSAKKTRGTKPAPSNAVPASDVQGLVYRPVQASSPQAVPTRRVVLAWRRSFTRYAAIAALRNAVYACELAGVQRLS